MASQIVHFARLSDHDRKTATPLPKLVAGDRLSSTFVMQVAKSCRFRFRHRPPQLSTPFWRICCAGSALPCWPRTRK